MLRKHYSIVIVASVLGVSALGYQLWHDDESTQSVMPTKIEGEVVRIPSELSEELVTPAVESDGDVAVGEINSSEEKTGRSSALSHTKQSDIKQSQAEKLNRLIELNAEIDQQNAELAELIEAYDKDLSNKQNQNTLSSALQNNDAYKSNLLEKFKMDNDKVVVDN